MVYCLSVSVGFVRRYREGLVWERYMEKWRETVVRRDAKRYIRKVLGLGYVG